MADSLKGQKDTLKDKISKALHKVTGGQDNAEFADVAASGEYSEEGDYSGSGGDADFAAAGEVTEDLSAAGQDGDDFSAAGADGDDFSAAGDDAELEKIDGGVRSNDF